VTLVKGVTDVTRNDGAIESSVAEADAPASLRATLARVAQPVWVVDHEGTIVFANPAAVSTLGYDDLSELLGRNSHYTIHYKRPDGTPFPADECTLFRSVREA
jgi:PAS domain-containing protein